MLRLYATAALACLTLVLTGGAAALQLTWNQPEADNEPHLTGYLVWKDGQRRIVWGSPAASDDNLPARPSAAEEAVFAQSFAAERLMNQGFKGGMMRCPECPANDGLAKGVYLTTPAPTLEFESEPLPFDVYLNLTRGFQAALYLQAHEDNASPCSTKSIRHPIDTTSRLSWFEPQLDVELSTKDGVLLGGAYGGDHILWSYVEPTKNEPADPSGYGTCYYSMHPEAHFLPKGTVLRFRVHHALQQYHYAFGFAGDHHSFLRLWMYPTDEVYYRYPELRADPEEADAMAGLGLALLLPGLAARRRRWLLLAGLVLAGGLAGCLGKGTPGATDATDGSRGRVSNTFVPVVDPGGSPGAGSIRGRVFDDLHVAVSGVHVSLLGSIHFAQTDGSGRFAFDGLRPGVYKLRFDKAEYRSFEAEVEVRASFISRADVMLFLLNPKSRDLRPHVHDYWSGATEKSLGTETIRPECGGELDPCRLPTSFRINPRGEDPNTILPGTGEVELRLQWDKAALAADKLGLRVYSPRANVSVFAPRGPGEPFRIVTGWEHTDIGHALYSSWFYEWFVPTTERRTFEEEQRLKEPGHDPGQLVVTAKIQRRGALALEPAHPDLWKGKDSVELIKDWNAYNGYNPAPRGDYPCLFQGLCYEAYYETKPFGKSLVPEGTKWLEVRVTRSSDPGYGFRLHYKPANVPPHLADETTLAGFKEFVPANAGGTQLVLRIPVKESETDDPYALWSGWMVTFRVQDEDAAWRDFQLSTFALGEAVTYTFSIVAHRTEMPT